MKNHKHEWSWLMPQLSTINDELKRADYYLEVVALMPYLYNSAICKKCEALGYPIKSNRGGIRKINETYSKELKTRATEIYEKYGFHIKFNLNTNTSKNDLLLLKYKKNNQQ